MLQFFAPLHQRFHVRDVIPSAQEDTMYRQTKLFYLILKYGNDYLEQKGNKD